MKINEITNYLESLAPLELQEDYDNSGFITGDKSWNISNILVCLDCNEEVVEEAITKSCNLIVTHHPIIFSGLKSLVGNKPFFIKLDPVEGFDVNTPLEFKFAEYLFKRKNK